MANYWMSNITIWSYWLEWEKNENKQKQVGIGSFKKDTIHYIFRAAHNPFKLVTAEELRRLDNLMSRQIDWK